MTAEDVANEILNILEIEGSVSPSEKARVEAIIRQYGEATRDEGFHFGSENTLDALRMIAQERQAKV